MVWRGYFLIFIIIFYRSLENIEDGIFREIDLDNFLGDEIIREKRNNILKVFFFGKYESFE